MTRLITILCLLPLTLMAQTGGKNAFPYTTLFRSARAAALGRIFITAYDDDINTGIQNPAALNSNMDNAMGFNQALLAGGINHGMVTYGKDIGKIGTGAIHLRYVAYGKIGRAHV